MTGTCGTNIHNQSNFILKGQFQAQLMQTKTKCQCKIYTFSSFLLFGIVLMRHLVHHVQALLDLLLLVPGVTGKLVQPPPNMTEDGDNRSPVTSDPVQVKNPHHGSQSKVVIKQNGLNPNLPLEWDRIERQNFRG